MKLTLLAAVLVLPMTAIPQSAPTDSGSPDAGVRQFIERAAQTDMTQAHLGDLASKRAASQEVKDFGQQLAKEHQDAYNGLAKLAAPTSLTVPTAIDAQHQKTIQRLEKLSGDRFDREFKKQVIDSHQQYADWLRQLTNQSQNEQVKQYASNLLPEVQRHLESARNLGGGSSNAADRAGTAADARGSSSTVGNMGNGEAHQGTVVKYEQGAVLELKVRERIGRHRYNLSAISADVPADLKVGDHVTASERVDANGARTLVVRRADATRASQTDNQKKTGAENAERGDRAGKEQR